MSHLVLLAALRSLSSSLLSSGSEPEHQLSSLDMVRWEAAAWSMFRLDRVELRPDTDPPVPPCPAEDSDPGSSHCPLFRDPLCSSAKKRSDGSDKTKTSRVILCSGVRDAGGIGFFNECFSPLFSARGADKAIGHSNRSIRSNEMPRRWSDVNIASVYCRDASGPVAMPTHTSISPSIRRSNN